MKKSIFGALAVILPLIALSQQPRKWDKRPMSEFRNDTIEYIKHNFRDEDMDMKEYFKGKTIGEIIPELGFKVKYISALGMSEITGMVFVAIGRGNRNGTFTTANGIIVIFATPISAQSNPAAYNKLDARLGYVPFTKELLDLIKDMKVKSIAEIEEDTVVRN